MESVISNNTIVYSSFNLTIEDGMDENILDKYYLLQSSNPNLSDCRPTILRSELNVSFNILLSRINEKSRIYMAFISP